MWRPRVAGLWRDRQFLKLMAGQTVSLVGTQVTFLAFPLTAALVLDASAGQMGLLGAAVNAPALLVGLPAGAWVDRRRKQALLIAADLGRAVLLISVPIVYAFDLLRIEQLYLVGFLVGTLDVVAGAAQSAFLVAVVRRDRLLEAHSALSVSRTAAFIGGPGLAGALVQLLTAPVALLADAFSFAVSAAMTCLVRAEEPAPAIAERRQLWREIGEGFRFVVGDRLLRAIAGNNGTWRFFDNVVDAVLVLYLTREVGLRPGLLGIAFVGGPIGFTLASLVLPRLTRNFGLGPVATWGAVLGSVGGILYAAVAGPTLIAAGLLIATQVVMGFGAGFYSTTSRTLQQIATPDRLLGRVNASFSFLTTGVAPLGALVGGLLGEAIGLRPTLVVGAAGGMAAFLWVWRSPLRTLREPLPSAETDPTAEN